MTRAARHSGSRALDREVARDALRSSDDEFGVEALRYVGDIARDELIDQRNAVEARLDRLRRQIVRRLEHGARWHELRQLLHTLRGARVELALIVDVERALLDVRAEDAL